MVWVSLMTMSHLKQGKRISRGTECPLSRLPLVRAVQEWGLQGKRRGLPSRAL